MGSSAAFKAGHMPKKMPTVAEKPSPEGERPPWQRHGEPGEVVDRQPDGAAEHDAEQAADRGEEDRLDEELRRISRRRAPSALRTPISRVRSVTRWS